MAKKRMLTVPFHEIKVVAAGDVVTLTFVKKQKGGKVALATVDIDRRDQIPGRQKFLDIHTDLVAAASP